MGWPRLVSPIRGNGSTEYVAASCRVNMGCCQDERRHVVQGITKLVKE